jgi:hypothetical protein
LFALFLRLYFFGSVVPTYPEYYDGAYMLAKDGNFPTMTLRFMAIFPTVILFIMFGISEKVALIYPLLTSLGTIILVYFIAKFFYDSKTGLIAAFLTSFFPLQVVYATQLISDSMLPFYITLSIFFFIRGEFSDAKKLKIKRPIYLFLAGFVLALAYLTKIIALMFVIFYIVYVIYKIIKNRRIDFSYSYLMLGFLLVFGIESMYYYSHQGIEVHGYKWEPGDILFHVRAHTYAHETDGNMPKWFSDSFNKYPDFLIINRNDGVNYVGFFYLFMFLSALYLLITKEKKAYFIIFIFIFTYLYLEVGLASATHTVRKLIRYTLLMTPFGILCVAFFLRSFKLKKFYGTYLKIILVIFLLVNSIFAATITHNKLMRSTDSYGFRMKDIQNTYQYFKYKTGDIYTTGRFNDIIPFYFGYEQNYRFKELKETNSFSDVHNAFVITNEDIYSNEKCKNSEIPYEVCNPPKNWNKVAELKFEYTGKYDDNPNIYPIIYYIP